MEYEHTLPCSLHNLQSSACVKMINLLRMCSHIQMYPDIHFKYLSKKGNLLHFQGMQHNLFYFLQNAVSFIVLSFLFK